LVLLSDCPESELAAKLLEMEKKLKTLNSELKESRTGNDNLHTQLKESRTSNDNLHTQLKASKTELAKVKTKNMQLLDDAKNVYNVCT